MTNYHISVLLQESLEYLNVEKGKQYIDATLGGGGHTLEILKKGGRVLGIDVDQDALDHIQEEFKIQSSKFKIGEDLLLAKGNFRNIDEIAKAHGFTEVAGILFDFGVSSHQLDTSTRGFSFLQGGPLDMRMDQDLGVTAKDLLQALQKKQLYELLQSYGEESHAWIIAEHIIRAREVSPITTTNELSRIVERAVPRGKSTIHPATRVFQALRIAVNDEMHTIEEALPKAVHLLKENGRLVTISFHSLEDRIVKHAFLQYEKDGIGEIVTKKPIEPTNEEIASNNRSRSARLRAFIKK